MIEVLSKPAGEIDIQDIKSLIDSEVPEGEQIEFKESLSTKGDSADPWMSGKDRIGDRAKNEMLEEVVAFANAHGGALLLGIRESDTKPPVAAEISPIPRCADLAERLQLVFRDCVEPQLPRIEIFAVPTESDGGVVIIRVGRSRLAPHRVTKTLVCPVRRSDRCEKMSMREIQDMTLNVSRGIERLERWLSERSERFQQEFKRLSDPENAVGIRVTAMPVGDEIRIDRVFRQGRLAEEFNEPWRKVLRRQGKPERVLTGDEIIPSRWRPMLRAARAELLSNPNRTGHLYNSYRELHCDGLIELGVVLCVPGESDSSKNVLHFPYDFPILLFANLIAQTHRVRNQAGVPMAEYAAEVEICVKGRPAVVRLGDLPPPKPVQF